MATYRLGVRLHYTVGAFTLVNGSSVLVMMIFRLHPAAAPRAAFRRESSVPYGFLPLRARGHSAFDFEWVCWVRARARSYVLRASYSVQSLQSTVVSK